MSLSLRSSQCPRDKDKPILFLLLLLLLLPRHLRLCLCLHLQILQVRAGRHGRWQGRGSRTANAAAATLYADRRDGLAKQLAPSAVMRL